MEVPMTFADFAMTEGRFRKHFRKAPPETWNEDMVPLHEFLEMDADDREGRFPYIWGVDAKNRLMRVLVAEELVRSCEERLRLLAPAQGPGGHGPPVRRGAVRNQAKAEMAQKLTASLLAMATGGECRRPGRRRERRPQRRRSGAMAATAPPPPATGSRSGSRPPSAPPATSAPTINPKIFAYNDQKQAIVVDPKGGPYKDIVKAAEKCTAGCIHPGHALEPGGEGPGQADEAGGEVPVGWREERTIT